MLEASSSCGDSESPLFLARIAQFPRPLCTCSLGKGSHFPADLLEPAIGAVSFDRNTASVLAVLVAAKIAPLAGFDPGSARFAHCFSGSIICGIGGRALVVKNDGKK